MLFNVVLVSLVQQCELLKVYIYISPPFYASTPLPLEYTFVYGVRECSNFIDLHELSHFPNTTC